MLRQRSGLMESDYPQHPVQRERVTLRCAVSITVSGRDRKLQAVTENLGSDGFYCVLTENPAPGESFETEILLPTGSPWTDRAGAKLLCLAHVKRVDEKGPHLYGVDFSINDYTIVTASGSGR
jgi:hypothetical protein